VNKEHFTQGLNDSGGFLEGSKKSKACREGAKIPGRHLAREKRALKGTKDEGAKTGRTVDQLDPTNHRGADEVGREKRISELAVDGLQKRRTKGVSTRRKVTIVQ